MNCEKAFDRYLLLDKNERVPLSLTLHLLFCSSCRNGVRYMTRSEEILAKPLSSTLPSNSDDPVIALVLERITAAGLSYTQSASVPPEEYQVSLFRWLVSGFALIVGFAVIPFTSIGVWSNVELGNAFSVPFYILCGVAITAYCGLFIGTNIDFFVKKFGFQHTA